MEKVKQILPNPVMYLIVYEAQRQIEGILKLLRSKGYEDKIRLDTNNWAMYNKDDNAEYHFDRYDSVMEYDYINNLKIMDSVKEIVGKEQIEKWKNMMV